MLSLLLRDMCMRACESVQEIICITCMYVNSENLHEVYGRANSSSLLFCLFVVVDVFLFLVFFLLFFLFSFVWFC